MFEYSVLTKYINEQAYNDYLTAWLNGIEYEIHLGDNFIQTKGKDFNMTEEKGKDYIAYEKSFVLNGDLFLEETIFWMLEAVRFLITEQKPKKQS